MLREFHLMIEAGLTIGDMTSRWPPTSAHVQSRLETVNASSVSSDYPSIGVWADGLSQLHELYAKMVDQAGALMAEPFSRSDPYGNANAVERMEMFDSLWLTLDAQRATALDAGELGPAPELVVPVEAEFCRDARNEVELAFAQFLQVSSDSKERVLADLNERETYSLAISQLEQVKGSLLGLEQVDDELGAVIGAFLSGIDRLIPLWDELGDLAGTGDIRAFHAFNESVEVEEAIRPLIFDFEAVRCSDGR